MVEGATVGPIAYGAGASIVLDRVPNGTGHVAVAEVVTDPESDFVLLFARSEPFDLLAGRELEPIRLELRAPPSADPASGVRIVDATEYIDSPQVTLELSSDTAVTAEVSNLPSFEDSTLVDLAETEPAAGCPPPPGTAPAPSCQYRIAWDLDGGVEACGVEDFCPRQVFVRFRDASGVRSRTASARVIVDTKAPELVQESFTPLLVARGAPTTLEIRFQEPLSDLTLRTQAANVQLSRLTPPEGSGVESTTFTYEVAPASGEWSEALPQAPAAAFDLEAQATDRAGNQSAALIVAGPPIDARPPTVSSATVSPARWSGADPARAELSFRVSEPVAAGRVALTLEAPNGEVLGLDEGACGTQDDAQDGAFEWRCAIDAAALDLTAANEAPLDVQIEAFDPAGNRGVAQTAVLVDYVAPRLVDPVNVDYVPDPDNPVLDPSRAKDGTLVTVRLVFDEILAGAPTLVASSGTATLTFALDGVDRNVARFSLRIDAARHAAGAYAPEVRAEDRNGNARSTPVPATIEVDLTGEGLLVDQAAVSYLRAPFTRAAPEPLTDAAGNVRYALPAGPSLFMVAPADPFEARADLPPGAFGLASGEVPSVLRFWADPQLENFLGQARVGVGGTWARDDLRLVNLDAPCVYATGYDAAGNGTAPVLLERVWYVASTALSSQDTSPHAVQSSGRPARPLAALSDVSTATRAQLAQPDGRAVRAEADYRWRPRADLPVATGGTNARRIVYDAARGRVLLFGESGRGPVQAWDGRAWTPISGPTPPQLAVGSYAYDPRRDRVVALDQGRTWEFVDGARFVDSTPPGPSPQRGQLVYHPRRAQTLAFEASTGHLWTWDGAAWTRTSTAPGPGPRTDAQLAYDAARDRVVLFGGRAGPPFLPAETDTWEWDGAAWSATSPTRRPPALPAFSGGDFVYDAGRQRSLLVFFDNGQLSTWAWDGADWTDLALTIPRTIATAYAWAAYDAARDRVVLLAEFTNETLELGPTGWTSLRLTSPSARARAGATYDPNAQAGLLFGGVSLLFGGVGLPELWAWDGVRWTEVAPTGPVPPVDAGIDPDQLVYDDARGRAVLLAAGRVNPWEWDGARWLEVVPTGTVTPAGTDWAVTYDPVRQRTLLFGGRISNPFPTPSTFLDQFLAWDGARWTPLPVSPSGPSARDPGAFAFAPDRGGALLVSGNGSGAASTIEDEWLWDGAAWARQSPTSPVSFHQLTVDPVASRLIAYDGGSGLTSTRMPDGAWKPIARTGAPPARSAAALIADPARGEVVLFGGYDETAFGPTLADTWLLEPPTRGAMQFVAALPAEITRASIEGLSVRAYCGGRGRQAGQPVTGADLLVYAYDDWTPLGSHLADLPDPASASDSRLIRFPASGTTTATAAAELIGPGNRVFLQCRPSGPSEDGFSQVALDFADVRVRYRAQP